MCSCWSTFWLSSFLSRLGLYLFRFNVFKRNLQFLVHLIDLTNVMLSGRGCLPLDYFQENKLSAWFRMFKVEYYGGCCNEAFVIQRLSFDVRNIVHDSSIRSSSTSSDHLHQMCMCTAYKSRRRTSLWPVHSFNRHLVACHNRSIRRGELFDIFQLFLLTISTSSAACILRDY